MILMLLVIWLASESIQKSTNLVVLFFYSFPSEFLVGLVPHEPILLYYGRFYSPFVVALVAVVGTVLAEAINYSVFSFISETNLYEKMTRKKTVRKIIGLFNKNPFTAIVIAGFTPVPFFPIRFLVVMSRYPLIKYMLGVFLSRAPRFYILAKIGDIFKIPGVVLIALFIFLIITVNVPIARSIFKKEERNSPEQRGI
ncbi:VTT domain-containing protein [Candidatus Latescibacterota bacterium]